MDLIIDKAFYHDWEFIRELRNSQKQGFIQQHEISDFEHYVYMLEHGEDYYIAERNGHQVGFVGVVNGDIRFAVHSDYQGQSIGTKLLKFIKQRYPYCIGKVKKHNIASNKAFEKANFVLYYETDQFKYWVPEFGDYRAFPDPTELE